MPEQITIKELERLINTTTFKSVAVKQRFQAQLRKLRTEERKRDVAADVAALHQEVTSNLPPVEAFSAGRPGFAAPALPPPETSLLEQLEIDLERHGAFLESGVKPSRRAQFTQAEFRRVLRTFIDLKPEPPSPALRDLITKVTTAVGDLIPQLSSVEKKQGRPDNASRLQAEGNEFEKAAREYAELIAPLVSQGFRAEAPAKTFAELTGKKTKLTSRDLGPVVPVAPSTRAIISDEAQIREVKVPKAPSPFGPAKSVSARTQDVLPLYPVAQAKKTRAAGKQARRDVLVPVYRGALVDPASGRKPYFGAVLVNTSPYGIEAEKKSKRRNADDGGSADYDDADYDDYDDYDYAAQDGDGRIIVPASLIQMTMLRYTLSYPMEKGAAENAIRVMRARTEKIVGSKRKDRVGLDLYTSGHFIIDFFRLFGAWSAAPPSNTTSELVSKWNSYRELLMRSTQALLGYAFMVATPLTGGRYVSLNEARIETRKARLAREWKDILSTEPPALAQEFVAWVLQVMTLGQLANDVKQTGVDNKFDPQLEANFNVFLDDVFAESNYTYAQIDALTKSIREHIRRLVPRQRGALAAASLESEKNKFLAAQGDFIAQEAQRNYDYYTNPEHVKLSAAGMVVRLLEEAGKRFDQSYATFCEYRTDNAWLAKQSADSTSIAKLIKSARGQFIATINQMTADKQLGPRENAGERADDIMDSPEIQGNEQAPSPWVGESGTAARAVDDRDAAGSEAFIIDWLNESNTFFGVLLDPSSQVYRNIEGDLDDPDAYEVLEDSFQTFGPHNVVTIAQYYRQYAQDVQGPAKNTSFRTYAGPAEYYSAESSSVYGNLDADDDDFDADDYGRMNSGGARTAIKKPRLMVMRIVYENDVLKPAEVGKWSEKDIAARAEYEEASREAGMDPDPMAQFSIQDRGFATKFRDALHGMFSTATDSQDDDLGDIVFSGEDDGEEWDQEYVVPEYPEVFRVQFIWPYASEPLALSDVFLQPDLFGAMLSDFILRQVLPETCDGEVFNHLNYYLVSRYQDFGNLLAASSEESGLAGTDTVLSSLRDMYGSPEPREYSKQFAQDAYPYGFMHVVGSDSGGGGAGAKVIVGEPTEDSPGWKYATYPNLRELDDSEFVEFGLPSDIVEDLRARTAAETAKARDTHVRELLSQAKVKTVRAASTKMPRSSDFMPMWPDTVSYIENNLVGTYDAVFKAMSDRMRAWANDPASARDPEFMLPAFNPPESFITAVSKDALKMGDDRSQVITNAIEFWLKAHQAKEDSVREAGLKADLDQRAENAALLSNPQNPLAPARGATRQLIYQELDDIYFPLYVRIFGDDPEDSLRAVRELDEIGQQMLADGVYDFLPYRAMAGLYMHLDKSEPGLRGDVGEEIEPEPEPEPEMPRENRGRRKSSSAHAHARPRRALTPRENAQLNALTEGPAYIVREAIVTAAPKHQNNLRNAFRAAVAALTKRGLVTTNTGSLELTTKGQVAERKLISKLLKDGKALRGVVVTYERLVRMEQRRREVIAKLQNNVREMAARTNPPAPRDNPSGYALSGQTQMRRMFDPRVGTEVMTEVVEYRPQVFQDPPTFKRGQKQHQGRTRVKPPYRPRIYLPVDPDHPTTQAFYEDISVPTHDTIRKTLNWSTRQHNAGMNSPTYAPDEMVPMGRKWRGAGQRGAAARATQVETLEQQARKKRDAEKAAKPKKEPRTPKSKAVASAPVAAPKAPAQKAPAQKAPEKKVPVQQVVAMGSSELAALQVKSSELAALQVKFSRVEVQRLDEWLDLMDRATPSTDPNARNKVLAVLAERNENARIAGLPERAGSEPASTPKPTSKFKMPARKSKAVAAVDVTDAYEHTTPSEGARNRNLDIDVSLAFQYRDHGRDVLEAVPEYTAMVGALRKKQNLKGSQLDLKNARTSAVAMLKAIADGQESGFNSLFNAGYITEDTLLMLDVPGEPQYVAAYILDLMQRAFT